MKISTSLLILAGLVGAAFCMTGAFSGSHSGYTVAAVPVVRNGAAGPEAVEDSMHEFMEYVFQPTYRRLKLSMAAEPNDNKDWKTIKSDSLILAESCNLLFARLPAEARSVRQLWQCIGPSAAVRDRHSDPKRISVHDPAVSV